MRLEILIVAEFAIALLLLFVESAWFGAIGGLLLLSGFIAAMLWQMWKGEAPDCHCFGQIHSEPVGKRSLIRNAVFAILTLFLVIRGQKGQGLSLEAGADFVLNPRALGRIEEREALFGDWIEDDNAWHAMRESKVLSPQSKVIAAALSRGSL